MPEDHFTPTLTRDLLRWLEGNGQPTDGVVVLSAVPLLSTGDAPEYAVVLWRDGDGRAHVRTAWQYRNLWSADDALWVLEARADVYQRLVARSREFVAMARTELPQ